jgi:hypothetical protein
MLIDIEKFVRQYLPPNKRLPVTAGLATTLFSGLDSLAQQVNDFMYASQFDTGTPGQVGVLEYILQNYVNGSIRVLNADGVNVDFRVLVPAALSSSERGEVVRIVERYRLRSKRYQVLDNLDWGNTGPGPVTGLAFAFPVSIVQVGTKWIISITINKTGVFPFRLVNTTNGEVRIDILNFNFVEFTTYNYELSNPGNYQVKIAGITGSAVAASVVESTTKPSWLTDISVSWDPNLHTCSFWPNTVGNVDTELLVTDASGVPVNGLSWLDVPWNQNTWIDGTKEYRNGYTEVFRANPTSLGVGGITGGNTYTLKLRRTETPNDVFVFNWTAPITSISPAAVIALTAPPEVPSVGACKYGPFVASITRVRNNRLDILFDAEDVEVFEWQILSGSSVIYSGTQSMVLDGHALFDPSNRPYVTFPTLIPGTYSFRIRGFSCSSDWSSKPFTIVDSSGPSGPPVVTGPITPKVEMSGLKKHINVLKSGSSENWTLTDIADDEPPATGFEYLYQIGSQIVRQSTLLTGYKWETDRPCRILKTKIKIGVSGTWEYYDDGTAAKVDLFSHNCLFAIQVITFNEQT